MPDEEKVRKEGQEEPRSDRRDFLKQSAGLAGASAVFAHFMLLGTSGKAFAETCEGGTTDSCKPSDGNPDYCPSPYTAAAGDECKPAYSTADACDYGSGGTADVPQ